MHNPLSLVGLGSKARFSPLAIGPFWSIPVNVYPNVNQ